MFHKKSWKDVLHIFYANIPDDASFSRDTKFRKEKDLLPELSDDKKESILKFLNEHKLIEGYSDGSEVSEMRITKEGINLASQNEKIEKENKIQMNMALFTILLALTALWQTLRPIDFFEKNNVDLVMAGASMFVLILISLFNFGKIDSF